MYQQIICALAAVTFIIYCAMKKRYQFWKKLGIVYEEPEFLFGSLKNMVFGKTHIGHIFDEIYKSYPEEKFVGFFELWRPHLMIRDPQLIEQILIKDFSLFHSRGAIVDESLDPLDANLVNLSGIRWKMVRTKLTPTFSSGKLKHMYGLVEECVKDLNTHIKEFAENEKPLEAKETMARFTTDVIGRCAFGLDFNSLKDPESEYRKIGKKIFESSPLGIVKNLLRIANPRILHFFRIKSVPDYVHNFFMNLMNGTIEYRKSNNIERADFMQLMINIHEQEILNENIVENKELLFTDNLLAANMFIFYLAGFETTATTLTYVLYTLAKNPDIQDTMRNEINQVAKEHNGIINYDTLNKLTYMDMVISETLRMYDPVLFTGREAAKPYRIPNTSFVIPVGTRVTIPIYSIHHDPKYYPNPEKFIPERFSEDNISLRPIHTFLPFGDGPRICIGLRFAKVEIKSCLAGIIPTYSFSTCSRTPSTIRLKTRSILYSSKDNILLSVSKIN